jgi:hypothetical protein
VRATAGILLATVFLVAGACTSLEGLSASDAPDGGTDATTSPETATACEANLSNDIDNCGACGNRCSLRANSVPGCESGACTSTCNAGFGDCDRVEANGCETSLSADSKNCGACGRDCRGGTCMNGVCPPVVLAQTADGPYGMTSDATTIYWASHASSSIWACEKTGCPNGARKVATVTGTTYFVSSDDANVYFNSNSGDAMYRCPKAGCVQATLLTSANAPTLSVVHQGNVYWSTNDGFVRSVPVDAVNATSTTPGSGLVDPAALLVDGSYIYVALRSPGKVVRIPLVGGNPEDVATSLSSPQSLAMDSSGLYIGTSTGEIKRTVNGVTTTFATGPGPVGFAIKLTADDVYWTASSANGAVLTAPKATGITRVMAPNQAKPQALIVDETAVYWTNDGDGTVKMLPR